MAVGVTEAFNDVVACLNDTPSLWRYDTPRAGGGGGGGPVASRLATSVTTATGPHGVGRIMPGHVDLSETQDEDASGTCMC